MNKHVFGIASAAAVLALAGCSGIHEGVRFGIGTGQSGGRGEPVAKAGADRKAPAPVAAKETVEWALKAARDDSRADMVVIGEVGPLDAMDVAARRSFYAAYAKAVVERRPGHELALTQDDFVARIGGWSTVETYGIAGFVKIDHPAAVPAQEVGNIRFAPLSQSLWTGATGDLVAARANADGMLVIAKVLCREGTPDYRPCAGRFAKGRFDARSGAELGADLAPKTDGKRIDPVSYATLRAGA